MSGHSKWHNIRLRKGKQDAVRGKLFTKLAKEIIMAAKGGGNPDTNIRLRMAVQTAKQASVPADTIKRAIQRGTGELDGGNLDERVFEGYGPGGVAIIVESLTDNINRTFPELRSAFAKNGGRIGESGSVAYMFERKGILVVEPGITTEEALMEIAIEAGAEDVQPTEDGGFEVTTEFTDFAAVRDALDAARIATSSADIQQIPTTMANLDVAEQKKVLKLLDALEDNDDVQNVYHNLEFSDEALED
jgi:YebC/PmpR family DNA-binding regulatory protein